MFGDITVISALNEFVYGRTVVFISFYYWLCLVAVQYFIHTKP